MNVIILITNSALLQGASLFIQFEDAISANLGKRKADDVIESCKRVCGSGVSPIGVCESVVLHSSQDVGVGGCEFLEKVDESVGEIKTQVEEEKEATSLGAAGKLTGAIVVARQEP